MKSALAIDQATSAIRAGNLADAERTLRQRLLEQPDDAPVLAKLSELVLGHGQVDEATILLRRAATADSCPERHMALISHLQRHAGATPVLAEIESLPESLRSSFDVQVIEAAMHGYLGDHDRQIAIYQDLAAVQPGSAQLWVSLGEALRVVGREDEAIAAIRKGLALNPAYGEGWWTLANFKLFRFSDKDISTMRKELRRNLPDGDALQFHFALGKAFEDRKEFAKSFQHYEAGNALRRQGMTPESMRVTGFVDNAIIAYGPELFERNAGAGNPKPDPIFVVGLNRAGSTLIEQILASHPLIEGTTEISTTHLIWERINRLAARSGSNAFEAIRRFDASDFTAIGDEYLDRAKPFRFTDKPHFVDKLPGNWLYVGLIRLMLPNAKIIDARRHPLACGFSNFKQNYASGITWTYSLESIGTFYRDYWRLMRHFDQVQPGTVLRVLNERLIDDPEGQIRRMLDFIGVPFDAACLEFHRTERAIRTPSAEQVRRGISREGVDQWRNYGPWLGPMKQSLGEALANWDEVPASPVQAAERRGN